jgi:hypothetical protein
MQWLNANAGAVHAVATLVLVLITAWFAYSNHKISRALHGAVGAQRRAELLSTRQQRLELLSIAGRLQGDLLAVLKHQSIETITKMNREPWRADRENLQLVGAGVGGMVSEYAGTAAEALRVWERNMSERSRATDPDVARELWNESLDRLRTARWALEHLIEQAGLPEDEAAQSNTAKAG